jgi:fructose/tagatose bisphosphate aldolase
VGGARVMSAEAPAPHRIIIHSLDHARAALDAAATAGVPVVLASAEGAGGYAGPLWFKALVDIALAEHPGLAAAAVLDCGDEAGTTLGALRAGIKRVRFTGAEEVRQRLAAIAAQLGAEIESGAAPAALDLLDARDPKRLAQAYLAGNKTQG